jgi:hypothetical protein
LPPVAGYRIVSIASEDHLTFLLSTMIRANFDFQSFLGLYTCAKAMAEGKSGKPFSCRNNDPLFNIE